MSEYSSDWLHQNLESREITQVFHAVAYERHFKAAGVPGHNHLLLIAKLAKLLDDATGYQNDNTKDHLPVS